jgi:hypothetical protein
VVSFNTRTGAVTLNGSDIAGAGGALTLGVSDGSNAAAGQVGEYISQTSVSTGMPTATWTGLTAIALTAGDWQVEGNVTIAPTTAASLQAVALSTTYSGAGLIAGSNQTLSLGSSELGQCALTAGPIRYNVGPGGASISLIAIASFASGTCNGTGILTARRVR